MNPFFLPPYYDTGSFSQIPASDRANSKDKPMQDVYLTLIAILTVSNFFLVYLSIKTEYIIL